MARMQTRDVTTAEEGKLGADREMRQLVISHYRHFEGMVELDSSDTTALLVRRIRERIQHP